MQVLRVEIPIQFLSLTGIDITQTEDYRLTALGQCNSEGCQMAIV